MSSVCVVQTNEKYKVTLALPEKHEELLRQSIHIMHLREVMLILLQRFVEHKNCRRWELASHLEALTARSFSCG